MNFKDQCDLCNKFSYCKGYKGQVLCQECISKLKKDQKEDKKGKILQLQLWKN